MEATLSTTKTKRGQNQPFGMPITIPASILWNIVILVASILLANSIFQLDDFGNLGRPVQYFMGGVALVPALLAAYGSWRLYRGKADGRYITLIIQYTAAVFALIALLIIWRVFFGFEAFVDSIIQNGLFILGFPLAYSLFWLSRRNNSTFLRNSALFIGLASLILTLGIPTLADSIATILRSYGQVSSWLATGALIISGVLGWRLLHMGDYFGELPEHRTAWQGWLMLSPNIFGFMIFFAGPLLLSFYISVTDARLGSVPTFNGLTNYIDALSLEFQWTDDLNAPLQNAMSFGYTPLGALDIGEQRLVIGAKDRLFWLSLRNTFLFCALLIPLSTIPALALAIILNSKLPGMKIYRAIYFLPSVAAVVGTALIWRWLYDPTIGFYNYAITQLVTWLNQTFGWSLQDPAIQWLTGPGVVLFSIVLLSAWQVVGYNTVLFLAGLQGIPVTLYEAAMIDGANRWQQFRNVTLPMLAPTTFFVIITTMVTGLQVFNEPYTLFPAQPIPENATTAVYHLYRQGFFHSNFGYASAIAWILFIIIFSITVIQFRVQRATAYE